MAEGDNEMVWMEKTALYCTVRMRKGSRGEEKGQVQKQKPVWLMYYCRLHWYRRGTKNNFCLETRYWPMGGRHPIRPVEPDIHFTHWTKPKSPTVCMEECSSSLLQTFTWRNMLLPVALYHIIHQQMFVALPSCYRPELVTNAIRMGASI